MSWVKISICCSSFIESSNVGLRRCLFWSELNSFSRFWIFVNVYWASSKLSVHSGGTLTWVAWLLPWTSTSWRTKESVSDMLYFKQIIINYYKSSQISNWVTYLLRVKITTLNGIVPHQDKNFSDTSRGHFLCTRFADIGVESLVQRTKQ